MRKKIEDAAGFEKDSYTKAVVSVDTRALDAYKKQRERLINMKKVENEVDDLKNDVAEIKTMLSAILQKLNN